MRRLAGTRIGDMQKDENKTHLNDTAPKALLTYIANYFIIFTGFIKRQEITVISTLRCYGFHPKTIINKCIEG